MSHLNVSVLTSQADERRSTDIGFTGSEDGTEKFLNLSFNLIKQMYYIP